VYNRIVESFDSGVGTNSPDEENFPYNVVRPRRVELFYLKYCRRFFLRVINRSYFIDGIRTTSLVCVTVVAQFEKKPSDISKTALQMLCIRRIAISARKSQPALCKHTSGNIGAYTLR
jgi:hypothetical protein